MEINEFESRLFDFFTDHRQPYGYVESTVSIKKSGDKFSIAEVDWGYCSHSQINLDDIKEGIMTDDNIEDGLKDIESEGFYTFRGLFKIGMDSDDYRSWSYLEECVKFELDFDGTFESAEKIESLLNNSDYESLYLDFFMNGMEFKKITRNEFDITLDGVYSNYKKAQGEISSMDKDSFVDKIKSDSNFSKKWDLKIAEKDLSFDDKIQWVMKYTDVEMENLYITEEASKETTPNKLFIIVHRGKKMHFYEKL